MKEYRPKVAIHPHKSDYCDTCKYHKEEISRQQAVFKRLTQSGSANRDQLQATRVAIETHEGELKEHKEEATAAREYYNTMTKKCEDDWKEIQLLQGKEEPSEDESTQLAVCQHKFTLVLSADYQQSKLIPHWGESEQPGSTYYLQKVSHDVFGLVDHRNDGKHIVLFEERLGPKNTDHTISLLLDYINKVISSHTFMRRVCIFLDNAGNTNKNKYLFSWGMEMVDSRKLDYIRFCFLVAGHTKFAPDRLFALTANAYNKADVFNIEELQNICQRFGATTIAEGADIGDWRSMLALKYSDLPGLRKMHDFLIIRNNDNVIMKVRKSCHVGVPSESPLSIVNPSQSVIPSATYADHLRPLSSEKTHHMSQMYTKYVSPDRWPNYVTPSATIPARPQPPSTSTKSLSGPSHLPPSAPPPAKRPKKCPTPGCDGSGHRNKQRWNEGHTTKMGCPRVRR